MSIYSLHMQTVKRSEGRCSTACAAYRSGAKIFDIRTGQEFDYSRRRGVLHSEIVGWAANDRAALWNAAEAAEKRKDSQVARECVIALPHELPLDVNIRAVRLLAEAARARWGVAVDFNIHAPDRQGDARNIHCHFMTTVRAVQNDKFGDKTRQLDVSTQSKYEVEWLRGEWETIANRALAEAQTDARIDRRSLVDRGETREPHQTLGHAASALERKGRTSAQGNLNRAIEQRNDECRALQLHIERLEAEQADAMMEVRRLEQVVASVRAQQAAQSSVTPASRTDQRILDARVEVAECRRVLAITHRLVTVTVDDFIEDSRYRIASLEAYEQSALRHRRSAEELERQRPILTRVVNWTVSGWRSHLDGWEAATTTRSASSGEAAAGGALCFSELAAAAARL